MSNISSNPKPSPNISIGGSPTVQLIEHGRDIHMYRVTDIELDVLKSNYESSNLNFWQLCLGIFIGFLVPLLTVQLSDRMCAIFSGVTFASGISALSFGIKWGKGRAEAKQHIKQIKERISSN
jgi:hypothetical protein